MARRQARLAAGAGSLVVSFVKPAFTPVAYTPPAWATSASSATDVAIELPLGRLGVSLADAPNGEVLVEDLGEASPLRGLLAPGDALVSLNAARLTGRDAEGVASALGAAADSPRRLVVRRAQQASAASLAVSPTAPTAAAADPGVEAFSSPTVASSGPADAAPSADDDGEADPVLETRSC